MSLLTVTSEGMFMVLQIAGLIAFKLSCILSGTMFAFMGYRLFLAGILKASDFELKGGEKWSIKISKAAPGTLFGLFGAIIVGFTVFTRYEATGNFRTGNLSTGSPPLLPSLEDLPSPTPNSKLK